MFFFFCFFFFKQKTAYEMLRSLVGSEMCIRDSSYTFPILSYSTCYLLYISSSSFKYSTQVFAFLHHLYLSPFHIYSQLSPTNHNDLSLLCVHSQTVLSKPISKTCYHLQLQHAKSSAHARISVLISYIITTS